MADDDPITGRDLQALLAQFQTAVDATRRQADLDLSESQINAFFDADGKPRVKRLKVPDPSAKGWREIDVPLLALAPNRPMHLSEVSLEFTALVSGLFDQVRGAGEGIEVGSLPVGIRLESPPEAGGGLATIRATFTPVALTGGTEKYDLSIRFVEPQEGMPVFVPKNDPALGPPFDEAGHNIILDTRTGLVWPILQQTADMSLRNMALRLKDPADKFFAYRFATEAEILQLIEGFGLKGAGQTPGIGPSQAFLTHFGALGAGDEGPYSDCMFYLPYTTSQYMSIRSHVNEGISTIIQGGLDPTSRWADTGIFLTRNT